MVLLPDLQDMEATVTHIRYPLVLIPHDIFHSVLFVMIRFDVVLVDDLRDLLERERSRIFGAL
jgi:hypothetical protein